MAISDLLKKAITKSAKFREAEENMQIQRKLEERQKSSDERELERFYEEEREKSIKRNLEEFRKLRQKEDMKTTVLSGKNIFKGKGNIMSGDSSIMKNNNRLLSMKANKERRLFFK